MSGPYHWPSGPFACPYCGEPDQEVEDLGDAPWFLSGDCGMCNKSFSVNTQLDEFYDEKGDVIKPDEQTKQAEAGR